MKLLSKKEKVSKRETFLKKALLDAQRNLSDAYDGLSNVGEPELIDSYIYELNAANLRYELLLREYKLLKNNGETATTLDQSVQKEKMNPLTSWSQYIKSSK